MSHLQYSVLSIDGGGIRGIIPCMVLIELEKRTGMPIAHLFDLIAGTSTGGMLAGGLTLKDIDGTPKNSAANILKFYIGEKGKRIFRRKYGKLTGLKLLFTTLFRATPMENVLAEEFGNARLKDSITDLLLTAYNTQEKAPFYFKTSEARMNPTEDCEIRDAIRATCAAPTYFPPKWMNYGGEFNSKKVEDLALIDGGVFANNPTILAYVETLQKWKASASYKNKAKIPVTQSRGMSPVVNPDNGAAPILMVSIGTGSSGKKYPFKKIKRWGVKWLMPLIDILMQGVSASVHYQMQHLLPEYVDNEGKLQPRYYRFNIDIDEKYAEMSDVSEENLTQLVQYGLQLVEKHDEEIDRLCELLKKIATNRDPAQMYCGDLRSPE